ncbi:MAG: hypothetical protein ACUVQG_11300 [Thermogutta sp.]
MMSPAAEGVIRRLDATRQQWWFFTLLTSCLMAASGSLGLFLLFILADAVFRFSQGVLLGAFLIWLGTNLGLLIWVVRRVIRSQWSLEATARRIEDQFPELQSALINVLQLLNDPRQSNPAFCLAAVNHAASQASRVRFEEAATRQTRWARFCYAMQTSRDFFEWSGILVSLILISVFCSLILPNWGSAATRLMQPWHFVPVVGKVQILDVQPGNTEVLVGSNVTILAKVRTPEKKPYEAFLYVAEEGKAEERFPMAVDKDLENYTFSLPAVLKPVKYRVEVGDSQSPVYRLGISEIPALAEVEVTLDYPAYLGKPRETFRQRVADLRGPQFSEATLRIIPSAPIAGGEISLDGKPLIGTTEDGGRAFVVKFPLLRDGEFVVKLKNTAGLTERAPRVNRVSVIPDQPPVVEIVRPASQSSVAVGDKIPVKIRAVDDYGLGQICLEMKVQQAKPSGDDGPAEDVEPVRLQNWENPSGPFVDYELVLSAERFQPGQVVMIRAVAWDRRNFGKFGLDLRPQKAESSWVTLRLLSTEDKVAGELKAIENLRAAIFRILEEQIRSKAATLSLVKTVEENPAQFAGGIRAISARQVDIRSSTEAVVRSISDTDTQERKVIKRVLANLVANEMLRAVQECERLAKLSDLTQAKNQVMLLLDDQEQIIMTLRKILDAARMAQAELLSEAQKRPGGDLPDDSRKKLEEIQSKLQEFLEQQKKVIEASEELAKTPVEDFSEKEEQLLKELAELQDDWSRFMTEAHADLSKLPEQDFANASVCQELNEIQTELKMAEDALLKKSVDIAVPLEQLGYEMAKELTTNLEKWLPDTPDRERWSQEESLSDQDKEAPMAELPGQLEDLIGELMEQEEDLFDEMEDVSSSAADSLDKGAGWDALDGPISNMSAKGVTGNRLPNTSEIGGRSGEGRSGKSSGEFVSDEAVGKGGRKTPSRLTPDPYMKGQIKDFSKDPTGGATGGGKESGQGGQGLEGPTPPPHGPRELQRLAGKQAELRNKAESISAQMQVLNYHHTDMEQLIETMKEIERDLLAGRYQNALRKREIVLQGLKTQKEYVGGEFEVKQDATLNVPKDIQKEILGSVQEPTPAGWEDIVRSYYRQLMGTSGSPRSEQ